ncbi:DUF962 domain-containing protein [Ottowia sp. VDI28]|uniref:Mpo1 family 2-hydroxy fatty acid dioxygenase n=1 Tax=Ottowia sp. VDI28 TaxID=3133968 RepID=UPI003C2D50B8
MKTIVDQLAKYAEYHRDRRNIATHFIGIPMIVLAVQVLLARPVLMQGAIPITAALIISVLTAIYYLRLDRPLGLLMTILLAIGLWMAQAAADQSTATWLWIGIGLFVVGWVIQFVGHIYEGRKPAFVDDVIGLIIGPLFVAAELVFLIGLRRDLQHAIEERAGPTRTGKIHATS